MFLSDSQRHGGNLLGKKLGETTLGVDFRRKGRNVNPMKKARSFDADVFYEVWRRGGDPDSFNADDSRELQECGYTAEEVAEQEMERQRQRRRILAAGLDAATPEDIVDED